MTSHAMRVRALVSIVAEVLLVSLLGLLFVGKEIFIRQHPLFAFFVLALSLVAAYNVAAYRGRQEFFAVVMVVTALLAVTWFGSRSFVLVGRSEGRFWAIALTAISVWRILELPIARRLPFSGTVVWTALGVVFYLALVMMDRYFFAVYPHELLVEWGEILTDTVRLGAVLGAGIGLGFDIGRLLTSRDESSEASPSQNTPSSDT